MRGGEVDPALPASKADIPHLIAHSCRLTAWRSPDRRCRVGMVADLHRVHEGDLGHGEQRVVRLMGVVDGLLVVYSCRWEMFSW